MYKKIFILMMFLLMGFVFSGCQLALEKTIKEEEVIEAPKLIGIWFLISNQNYPSEEYLKIYTNNRVENGVPIYSTETKTGMCDVFTGIEEKEINEDTIRMYEINSNIYINKDQLDIIFPKLMYNDPEGNITYQDVGARGIGSDLEISLSYSQDLKYSDQNDYSMKIKITFKMVSTLLKIMITEFSEANEVIKNYEITQDENFKYTVDIQTSYIVITDVYNGYTERTIFNRDEINKSKTHMLKFTNEYGFVNGNILTFDFTNTI